MLTNFDLPVDEIYHGQYPSRVPQFVEYYQSNGLESMMEKLKDTLQELGSGITSERLLNDIATVFAAEGYSRVAIKLLEKNQQINPKSGLSYYLTGVLSYWDRDYTRSIKDLEKAKQLNFFWYPVDPYIKLAKSRFKESKVKNYQQLLLSKKYVQVEGKDYADMDGVEIRPVASEKNSFKVAYYNAGNWVKYKIKAKQSGYYKLLLSATSNFKAFPNKITVFSNQRALGELIIPDTGGWDNWQDIPLTIELEQGDQDLMFQMTSGSCDFRGFSLEKLKVSSK